MYMASILHGYFFPPIIHCCLPLSWNNPSMRDPVIWDEFIFSVHVSKILECYTLTMICLWVIFSLKWRNYTWVVQKRNIKPLLLKSQQSLGTTDIWQNILLRPQVVFKLNSFLVAMMTPKLSTLPLDKPIKNSFHILNKSSPIIETVILNNYISFYFF